MNYPDIRIEGGLLSPDFLEGIHDAPGQRPADFGLPRRVSLVDEVTSAWGDVLAYWRAFNHRLARARDGRSSESPTTLTREQWVIPLLEALGYHDVSFQPRAVEVDGRTYAISHRAGEQGPPVHIVAIDQPLGERPAAGRGRALSPHALVQEYLNRTDDDLWGIVTNGAVLRLLRDSSYFTRPAYVEFDLAAILAGERLDAFFLLYRLAHRTRLPAPDQAPEACLLEQYYRQTVEQGGRIRDGLRAAVGGAITTLGNGFLRHPRNDDLRRRLAAGVLTPDAFYQQLLYLIYRLLFLMVAEERGLLEAAGDQGSMVSDRPPATDHRPPPPYYRDYFSLARLRRLAGEALPAPERFDDLYLGLGTLFAVFHDEPQAARLGVPALNGELFSGDKTPDLAAARLSNRDLLAAVDQLGHFTPADERVRRRVNYAALDVEELGSVYESLLDERPFIAGADGGVGAGLKPAPTPAPTFALISGLERKTTGSYYTPRELVAEVIKSALDPVIERVASAGRPGAGPALETSLLALRVIDPACGSGHFLLAAARRIGRALARARTGADEPPPEAVRAATRDAITHCIYGVDKNPLAVDLCKVALWIEGHSGGKPLTFLDYKVRCGDSLVGVFDLDVLTEGIPDEAYAPLTGDDKPTAAALKKRNKAERAGQLGLLAAVSGPPSAVGEWAALAELPEDTPEQVRHKQVEFARLQGQEARQRAAADLWTATFFTPLTRANAAAEAVPTSDAVRRALGGRPAGAAAAQAEATAAANRFFHWPLEFPHVFAAGGFDVVVGNPPWEKIKLEEQQFFASRDPAIATAANKAARAVLIKGLPQTKPALWRAYQLGLRDAAGLSNFLRGAARFPLTARGDINTYAIFSELARELKSERGQAGLIVPTGLVSTDTLKEFFKDLVDHRELVSFIGFINSRKIFPAIKDYIQFALLTLGRAAEAEFAFMLKAVDETDDLLRRFALSGEEFGLLNPNTYNCPVFRTRHDAELAKRIYRRVPVLDNERTGENPWGVSFLRMFDMSNDSHLFLSEAGPGRVPLYESKMMHQFDHRFATYEGATQANINEGNLPQTTAAQKVDPLFAAQPRYWVKAAEVEARLKGWKRGWLLGFRDIASATNERTAIFSLLPRVGMGNKIPLLLLENNDALLVACLLANFNALHFDYLARQKVAGATLNFFIVKQFPVLPPDRYTARDLATIVPRVLELVYTSWDMAAFAADVWVEGDEALRAALVEQAGEQGGRGAGETEPPAGTSFTPAPSLPRSPAPFPPFRWDDARRARIRAELDATYARLYGLTRDELRYILDPADVHGPAFPGETFRVLKEKEMKALGEYRTGRLVLAAWDA